MPEDGALAPNVMQIRGRRHTNTNKQIALDDVDISSAFSFTVFT